MIARTHVRSAIASDDGIAMITVIGVMMVVTILAVGSFMLANQALHEATLTEDDTRAFRAATAGIDTVLSSFDPAVTSYPEYATPDGTCTVTVTETGADAGERQIIAIGTGLDGSTERVVQRFFYINLWEMNFAGTGSQSLMSGSSGMNGTSNIWGPFYIKGDFAVGAHMSVMEGPLFVKGGLLSTTSGASTIGEETRPVRIYADMQSELNMGTVYKVGPFRSVPEITLPKLSDEDMEGYATLAAYESSDGKMSRKTNPALAPANQEVASMGGSYKFFGDTTSTIAPLGTGDTELRLGGTGMGSFGSWGSVETTVPTVFAGGETALYNSAAWDDRWDDFAYKDNLSGWDLLFISGTVFVDGPLVIDDDIMYIGNGTIVANGPVTLNGRVRPFSYSTAQGVVNQVGEDNKWALGIVTPEPITMKGAASQNGLSYAIRTRPFDYAGAFYTDKTLFVPQPLTSLRGSILSNKMEFASPNTDLVTNPLLPTYLPDSLPGGGEGIISLGLWSRG